MTGRDVQTRYILEGDSRKAGGRLMRDVLAYDPDGNRSVAVVVPNSVAVDVLEALRAAYRQGREDNARFLSESPEQRNCGTDGCAVGCPHDPGEGHSPYGYAANH